MHRHAFQLVGREPARLSAGRTRTGTPFSWFGREAASETKLRLWVIRSNPTGTRGHHPGPRYHAEARSCGQSVLPVTDLVQPRSLPWLTDTGCTGIRTVQFRSSVFSGHPYKQPTRSEGRGVSAMDGGMSQEVRGSHTHAHTHTHTPIHIHTHARANIQTYTLKWRSEAGHCGSLHTGTPASTGGCTSAASPPLLRRPATGGASSGAGLVGKPLA